MHSYFIQKKLQAVYHSLLGVTQSGFAFLSNLSLKSMIFWLHRPPFCLWTYGALSHCWAFALAVFSFQKDLAPHMPGSLQPSGLSSNTPNSEVTSSTFPLSFNPSSYHSIYFIKLTIIGNYLIYSFLYLFVIYVTQLECKFHEYRELPEPNGTFT